MNWNNETVLRFLELYKFHTCIWDPQHGEHRNRQTVNNAWTDIRDSLGVACTIKELKKKKESLMSAYRSYKTKIKRSESLGAGTGEVYQPVWFAFSFMDSFLGSVYSCNASIWTEDEETILVPDQQVKVEMHSNESNESNKEQEDSQHGSLQLYSDNSSGAHQASMIAQTPPPKKRHHNPPQRIQVKKQTDDAFSYKKHAQRQPPRDADDECSIFGVLVAKKLRKLTEERRDVMMVKINQLFVDERYEFRLPSSSRPTSASTMVSYSPSPPQMCQEARSPKFCIDADPLTWQRQ